MRTRSVKSVKDELIKKSREAMLAAVQIYNNPQITFKTEAFITLAVISWTYLMHAYYRSIEMDYRYYKITGSRKRYDKTKGGAKKHWELERCINCEKCTLDDATKRNLCFLIGIRHEIEHQMTNSIDEFISAKLQACAINYDYYLRHLFGDKYGISDELTLTIQFSAINPTQQEMLLDTKRLNPNIRNFISTFEETLSDPDMNNPRYAFRVLYTQINSNRKGQADRVIEFVKPDSPLASELSKKYLLVKETEKKKYLPSDILEIMQDDGFSRFNMHNHTFLWKSLDARQLNKNYGVLISKMWYWYDSWVVVVRKHCQENQEKYT